MKEKIVLFGKAKSLVGVISDPIFSSAKTDSPALILLNAGLLHRVGPNRLYVDIARKLARSGFYVFRFDFSGIGDSRVREYNIPFKKSAIQETQEAMDYLSLNRNIKSFVLLGFCSSADLAFHTACNDNRIVGTVLINGYFLENQLYEEVNETLKHRINERYYRKNLFSLRKWGRFFSGKSDIKGIKKYLIKRCGKFLKKNGNPDTSLDTSTGWKSLSERQVKLLLIYSEGSTAWDAFNLTVAHKLDKLSLLRNIRLEHIKNVDHVFTLRWSQKHLINLIYQWIVDNYGCCCVQSK